MTDFLHRLGSLMRKEFLALLRDRRSRIVLVAPPLMQLIVFAFAATLEVRDNAITLFNEDSGQHSRELVSRLVRAGAFSELRYVFDGARLADDIAAQHSLLALRIPADFSAKIDRGERTSLQVIADGRRSNSGQIAVGYISRIVTEYSRELRSASGAGPRGPPASELIVRNWFNPNLEYLWYNLPGLLMMLTTIVTMIVTALSVARERELGTFDQLLVSPYSPTEILLGKAIPAYLVALAEGLIIIGVGVFLYRVPFEGSLAVLYGTLSIYLFSLIGIGLFISSLCQTQQQAILGVFSFMLPAVLLSGFASPVENMPAWLQTIDWLNPLRHYFVISRGIFLKDLPFAMAWPHVWPLILIAGITLSAANLLFRHKLE